MKFIILLTSVIVGCSLVKNGNKSDLEKIEEIYRNRYEKNNIKKMFDTDLQDGEGYIWVKYNSDNPTISFNFKDSTLSLIVFYIDPSEIEKITSKINCNWERKEDYKTFNGHNYKMIKQGICKDRKLSYSYEPKRGVYELVWRY